MHSPSDLRLQERRARMSSFKGTHCAKGSLQPSCPRMVIRYLAGTRQGCTASKARAARKTKSSRCAGPTICTATGKPLAVKPHGTLAAGCCVRLKGEQNGVEGAVPTLGTGADNTGVS